MTELTLDETLRRLDTMAKLKPGEPAPAFLCEHDPWTETLSQLCARAAQLIRSDQQMPGDLDERDAWLRDKAGDLGYVLVPEREAMPDWLAYDHVTEVLTIHGIHYHCSIFRDGLAETPVGHWLRIVDRGDGVLSLALETDQHKHSLTDEQLAQLLASRVAHASLTPVELQVTAPMFEHCQCTAPFIKCDDKGCRCTLCGRPA